MIRLADHGDSSADFTYLLGKLEALVQIIPGIPSSVQGSSLVHGTNLPHYLSLLAGYAPNPEWFARCYPSITEYQNSETVDYAIVNAPDIIKDVLLSAPVKEWRVEGIRPRIYSFEERAILFSDFSPDSPEEIGYLYFADETGKPEGVNTLLDVYAYSSAGLLFAPVNPCQARISIHEAYTYQYYGEYTFQGSNRRIPVYMPSVEITIVDLLTGETLVQDVQSADPKAEYQVGGTDDAYCPINFFDRGAYLEDKLAGYIAALR